MLKTVKWCKKEQHGNEAKQLNPNVRTAVQKKKKGKLCWNRKARLFTEGLESGTKNKCLQMTVTHDGGSWPVWIERVFSNRLRDYVRIDGKHNVICGSGHFHMWPEWSDLSEYRMHAVLHSQEGHTWFTFLCIQPCFTHFRLTVPELQRLWHCQTQPSSVQTVGPTRTILLWETHPGWPLLPVSGQTFSSLSSSQIREVILQ